MVAAIELVQVRASSLPSVDCDLMDDHCLFERRDDGIGLITFNRPERMNAISPEMYALIIRFIGEAEVDPAVRCVVLTGAGRAFCAGIDTTAMTAAASQEPVADRPKSALSEHVAATEALRKRQDAVGLRLHQMNKPTIAIVNGHAIGAGFAMALACDMRVIGEAAVISTGFGRLGLAGDGGATYWLTKMVPSGIARELCFTSENIPAERARALGIANRVFPQETLLEQGLEFALQFAKGPTTIYGKMKENLNNAWHMSPKQSLDIEATNMGLSRLTNDYQEAIRAYRDRRPPEFTGT